MAKGGKEVSAERAEAVDRTRVRAGGAPLHLQVREAIQSSIANGAYPQGSVLPGEHDLAQSFDVSRITVKRALNDLAIAGQVRRLRGRGTIVTGGPGNAVVRGSFSTLMENLRKMGVETEVELLSVERIAPSEHIIDALDLEPGEKVERAARLRRLNKTPFSYLITYVPLDISDLYTDDELAKTPLLTLLDRSGASPTAAEQVITAVAADDVIARGLEVTPGSPLLKIFRVMKDKNDRPVQAIEAHYPPDRFHYHMRLTRHRDDDGDRWSDS
ncbi:MAG: UTRA domain-containing protein [Alphaproteobacteria bacterium]|nr:UTRA domain-containing protein [Alphaproteobacteria bacterium]